MERRLAAILAADVVGYSRLIREDEAGTLAALKAHRENLIEPKVAERKGRIVKLMGDGLLIEFPSAVEAVQCAVEIQHMIGDRNATVSEEKRIIYRIGINIGDIVVEDNDIYGDGVNLAARLESLSEPSGICVARNVFDQVKDKLDLTIEHLGERQVKNLSEPVTVYRVVLDDKAAALVTPVVHDAPKPERRRWLVTATAAVALLIGAGGMLWWQPWAPEFEPASVERMAFLLPDKPSIAVLAFDNLSSDLEQQYLSDSLSENIITALSRFSEFFVIARNSSFAYKGKPVKVQQVAEELGVRYVIEGSVQIASDRLRVTVQLIDATSGKHLWAERYDRDLQDIFAVQDEITQTIAATLKQNIDLAEFDRVRRKPTESLDAYELRRRGQALFFTFTRDGTEQAKRLYEKALALDPDFSEAYVGLAWVHINGYRWGWSETNSREESLGLALEMARKAVEKDPFSHRAHQVLASATMQSGDLDKAMAEYDIAIKLNPNSSRVLADSATVLVFLGRAEEAISRIKTAIRLNPRHPDWYLWSLGSAQYYAEQYEDALTSLKKMNKMPNLARRILASVMVRLGRLDEARAVIAEFLKNEPDFSIENMEVIPFKHEEDLERWKEDLRKAGIPEHPPS
jgi:TolB-like protein/class 3 adenylate cyclase/Tfp pilus assembly protein PilF